MAWLVVLLRSDRENPISTQPVVTPTTNTKEL
jgi:hypothetical protein